MSTTNPKYSGEFTEQDLNVNARGGTAYPDKRDISGPSDKFTHMAERESLHEPEYDIHETDGNGFAPQDPRHPDYKHTSVHNEKMLTEDGHKDFEDPLTEEDAGTESEGGNPYRKHAGKNLE